MGGREEEEEGGWIGGMVRRKGGRKSKQIRVKNRKRERVACKSVIRRRRKAKAWCMQRNFEQRSDLEGEGDIRESANQRKREREKRSRKDIILYSGMEEGRAARCGRRGFGTVGKWCVCV